MAEKVDTTLDIEIEETTQEEIVAEIDREAHERLHMSFNSFLEAYRSGDLPDTLAVNELIILLRFAGFGKGAAA